MPYARNALDGSRVYFEDDGGDGAAVVLHGGLLESVDLVRASHTARALQGAPDEFRLIYIDHRGLGRSDKPHEVEAYAMPLRVADAASVARQRPRGHRGGVERSTFWRRDLRRPWAVSARRIHPGFIAALYSRTDGVLRKGGMVRKVL